MMVMVNNSNMDSMYEFGNNLFPPPSEANYSFRVCEAFCHYREFTEDVVRNRTLIAKVYPCSRVEDADSLLKEGLRLSCGQYSRTCRLVDVDVIECEAHFAICFIIELQDTEADQEALERDDSQVPHPVGLSAYSIGAPIHLSESVQVKEASNSLIVKQFVRQSLFELSPHIREGMRQARVAHRHCCRVVDIAIEAVGEQCELTIVQERMHAETMAREAPYSEGELRRCLMEVGAALQHAKSLVKGMQGVSHSAIKADTIFLTKSGHFKLDGFQDKAPYAADVYSLGVTLILMGVTSRYEEDRSQDTEVLEELQRLVCSGELKVALTAMVAPDPTQRPTIEKLLEQFSVPLLTHIHEGRLRLFDAQSCLWGAPVSLSRFTQVHEGTVYTLLAVNRVLCCGGYDRREL